MKKRIAISILLVFFSLWGCVVPDANASDLTDRAIKRHIENEAVDAYRLKAPGVKIAVENGYVVLYGSVDRYIQKMIYEKIAWKTEGVIEVENEIRVVPKFPKTDAAIERRIEEIVQTYPQFQRVNMSVTVNAGVVDVLITLDHPADVLLLKNKIAEIEGVISIDIFAKFIA